MGDVLSMIEARVAEAPDRLLYCFLDQHGNEAARLTREGFHRRYSSIAARLAHEHGLVPGERVVLAYPPGLEMICAFFGCVRAGLIPVPVASPGGSGVQAALYRMEHVASDSGARAVLTTCEVRDFAAPHLADAPRLAALPWLGTDEWPDDCAADAPREHSPVLFLQYTSGSTSAPKGVTVSHDNIIANARLVVGDAGDVAVSWLPQHHDMGLIGYYINDALVGGTLYGFSPTTFIQRPALWLEAISRYRATATSAPNFAFEYCLRPGRIPRERLASLDLSSLRFLMAAAEPVRPSVYQAFLRAFQPHGLSPDALIVAYGLAENTLAVTSRGRQALSVNRRALAQHRVRPTASVADVGAAMHLMSCGRPLGETRLAIVDPESRAEAAPGCVGEIWVDGDSKCLGYWEKPEASAETFEARLAADEADPDAPRWLRTGDLGFMHEDELYVCGRLKDMIIVRGQNYYPQDIEAIVERACPAARGGAIAAFEAGADDAPQVVVVAELATSRAQPDPPAVLAAIRRHLGIEVSRILFVAPRALPKTSSGKLRRFMARQIYEEGSFAPLHEATTEASAAAGEGGESGPFVALRSRYGLTGEEDMTLAEAGIDSLDLVLVLHEMTDLLARHHAEELADTIDMALVQALTVSELFHIAERLESDPVTALSQLRLVLGARRDRQRAGERARMEADRRLEFTVAPSTALNGGSHAPLAPSRSVLLTGATGFMGPFLLASLLRQSEAQVHTLVRAATPEAGMARLREALAAAGLDPAALPGFEHRVHVVPGDLEQPSLGLAPAEWSRLAAETDSILHNGALVNYLFTYERMRAANVLGTSEVLRLAFEGRRRPVNYVSTTFIFGWATKEVLLESDANDAMELLDFGYSQSKWVADQLVLDARRQGLPTRIFRPALITPSLAGDGGALDITLRLLMFMIRHAISVRAFNQVSVLPADVTAANIVALSQEPRTMGGTFHMTRDDYVNLIDVIDIVTRMTGRTFEMVSLPAFVPEVIRRCTPEDPLFPLLDFLIGSIDNISSMEFKRYDNAAYQAARAISAGALPDPSLEDTVSGMLHFMRTNGMPELALAQAMQDFRAGEAVPNLAPAPARVASARG